jgi:general secretion pathway protein K
VRRRESGIAALTAILIVAVAASAATMMLSQQSAMLDQTMLVASRAQAEQYAVAGLDWARGVLAQDARSSAVDSLDEGWARPIVGLPVERAVVAGAITDEQGKVNLNNLVEGIRRSEPHIQLFRNLLSALDLSPELAEPVVEWMLPNGSDSYYLSLPRPYRSARGPISQVDELYRIRGFDARIVQRLRPYVTALPERTKLNANTANERVLAAAFGNNAGKIAGLMAERRKKPFETAQAFQQRLGQENLTAVIAANDFDVKSGWFSVLVRVQQDDVILGTEALVKREDTSRGGAATVTWKRPRY